MDKPLISVVIPVYNCERYLAEAIESVRNQTCQDLEILVVDDGSEDSSAEVARACGDPVKCVTRPHEGLGATRNYGVEATGGKYIAFLDADDIWPDDKLEKQLAAFKEDSDLDMMFGAVTQFRSADLDDSAATHKGDGETMAGYIAGAMLIKRDSFLRAGRFETHWQVGEFIDWFAKAKEKGLKIGQLTDVVLKRRLHDDNMGIRHRDARADYVRIVKASLDRRRNRASEAGT